ncbi:ornithine cyclodeaminase family protein [Carnobacterium maltaromaticum]|uniref:ornithine cyclodeaminase family protein n=1 Tax=Carnobacterium maltaromaticum TaxID=2751 RepID=UPI00298AE5E5|nr:ornithine cyclodeaminase family protein [Carnobacterium maltaromaticum]MDW5525511.1 ornithine cyclodeaminase family protein [Carnobacterium maltaromaticum]
MLILTKEEMSRFFTMKEAIQADKDALEIYSKGGAKVPLRTNLDIQKQGGQSLYMPAYAQGEFESLGVKVVSVYPNNIEKGLPSVPATMVVLDPKTGIVDAILDGTYLTQVRTGAVQGAATDILANKNAKIGALIGTGGQAIKQLEAMLAVRDLKEVRIFDVDKNRAESFALAMKEELKDYHSTFIAVDCSDKAVKDADIITSVTTSKVPTFSASAVKKGAHVNGVGAYTPDMCEIPADLIVKADKIIFDTMVGVLAEAGDFIQPLENELVTKEHYHGELGQVILGEVSGRESETDITIFKTVGSAVLDVVTAQRIVSRARELAIGTEIDL